LDHLQKCADNVIAQYELNSTMAPLYYPPSEARALIVDANTDSSVRSLSGTTGLITVTNEDLAQQILAWCEINDPNLKVVMYSGGRRRDVLTRLGLLAGLVGMVGVWAMS
jgi:hypothetical protein